MSDNHEKSADNHYDETSEYRKRRRPSLFPIESEVKRRNSSSCSHNLFNPHSRDENEAKNDPEMSEPDGSIQKEARSESEFQFKTPCDDDQMSDESQKKQTSSLIKDFEVETPFLPFGYQSSTKALWENEKVIPEEREDIEKKEPTNELEGNDIEVLDFQNLNKSEDNECFEELNETNDENIKISEDSNVGNTNNSSPLLKIELMSEINKDAERSIEEKEFEKEYLETISVRSLSEKEAACLKEDNELFEANQTMKSEILQEEYVSKASVYYENERKKLQRCDHYYEHFSESANSHKLAFSYIETISVRYTPIKTSDFDQQTERPKFENSNLELISVKDFPLNTMNLFQQTERAKFENSNMSSEKVNPFINENIKIGNPYFDKVDSVKKCNFEAQTSFENRLLAISEGYNEKIGMIKEMTNRGEQSTVELYNAEIQTERKGRDLSFSEQVNFTVCFDHENKLCNQIIGFENYLKQINEERKEELLEERAKKSVCKFTNTENCIENQKELNKDLNNISYKSFACQYDQKDIAPKPSIKRTSLVSNKESKQLPDDNDIKELNDDVEDNKKKKKGRKSKKELERLKIEAGKDFEEHVELPEPETVEKVRKSKRGIEKTRKDKKTSKEGI